MSGSIDWGAWHAPYAEPGSPLARRLAIVQAHIARFLDENPERELTVASACAGDGRDLLEVLRRRDDAARVRATLMELDPGNAARARTLATRVPGAGVVVREADAGCTDAYAGAVPADLLLLCGIFGNVEDADVRRTIAAIPELCARGGVVVWTRSRRDPDLTPSIRRWFREAGLFELAFDAPGGTLVGVGAHRLDGEPRRLRPGRRLFSFVR